MKTRYLYSALIIATATFSISLQGCGNRDAANKKEIVAYVNKEPIFDYDLKREIALRAKQDPAFKITPDTKTDELDMIINRKLILQDAMKKGLAREDRFVNTIKAFWEQTLIRDFIDYKKRAFKDYIFATDDEIKKYYDNLRLQLTLKVLRSKDKKYIDEAYNELSKDSNTTIIPWQMLGPVGYEDVGPGVLLEAFSMEVGESKILYDPPDYYLIMVSGKDEKALEPMGTLKPEIEKRVLENNFKIEKVIKFKFFKQFNLNNSI